MDGPWHSSWLVEFRSWIQVPHFGLTAKNQNNKREILLPHACTYQQLLSLLLFFLMLSALELYVCCCRQGYAAQPYSLTCGNSAPLRNSVSNLELVQGTLTLR